MAADITKIYLTLGLIAVLAFLTGFVGWVFNLFAIIHWATSGAADITALLVIRIVGVFVPFIGAVLGYF